MPISAIIVEVKNFSDCLCSVISVVSNKLVVVVVSILMLVICNCVSFISCNIKPSGDLVIKPPVAKHISSLFCSLNGLPVKVSNSFYPLEKDYSFSFIRVVICLVICDRFVKMICYSSPFRSEQRRMLSRKRILHW